MQKFVRILQLTVSEDFLSEFVISSKLSLLYLDVYNEKSMSLHTMHKSAAKKISRITRNVHIRYSLESLKY